MDEMTFGFKKKTLSLKPKSQFHLINLDFSLSCWNIKRKKKPMLINIFVKLVLESYASESPPPGTSNITR